MCTCACLRVYTREGAGGRGGLYQQPLMCSYTRWNTLNFSRYIDAPSLALPLSDPLAHRAFAKLTRQVHRNFITCIAYMLPPPAAPLLLARPRCERRYREEEIAGGGGGGEFAAANIVIYPCAQQRSKRTRANASRTRALARPSTRRSCGARARSTGALALIIRSAVCTRRPKRTR